MNPGVRRIVCVGVAAAVFAVTLSAQIKRTVLQQVDTSIPGREVVTARADFPAGGSTGLHTHPGVEISFVAEGSVEIMVDGASKVCRKGEAVDGPATVIANYVIEKGKPATTPVK